MRASPGGRVKCCISSVCLSVRPVPSITSKSESHRNLKFDGNITLDTNNRVSRFELLKVKVTGNKSVNIVFREYLRKVDLGH